MPLQNVLARMPNPHKADLLTGIQERYGKLHKLPGSDSLFELGGSLRIYVRYSKTHEAGRTFFGLRAVDLKQLEGQRSFICFITDDGAEPLFLPYADFEEVFRNATAAADGQYKVQLLNGNSGKELYIARQGRFSVEPYREFTTLNANVEAAKAPPVRLSHPQIQTLLAAIGRIKGYDIYVPLYDCPKLDWSLTPEFRLRSCPPPVPPTVAEIVSEIDAIWVGQTKDSIEALFEVEHSTTIYSGLLRFNDLLLTDPKLNRFSIVADESRTSCYSRQAFRPTFRKSGLSEIASFLEYSNVFSGMARLLQS